MSANETIPILVNITTTTTTNSNNTQAAAATTGTSIENEAICALSVTCSDSSAEDVHLVPEVVFDSTLDSPGVNRESQPLLGGLDVSYNQFPGFYPIISYILEQI